MTTEQITYIKMGDNYISDWKFPEKHRPIGRWGRMHRDYLKKHRPIVFNQLILSGKLRTYLADINEQAQQRMEVLFKQMMVSGGVTEELKEGNQMEWVLGMRYIRNGVEEIVLEGWINIAVKKERAPQGRSLSYGLWIHSFIYLR